MKRAILIILLVFTVVTCFGAEKFIGLSLGNVKFDDDGMDELFDDAGTVELRLQIFNKTNPLQGFTLSGWVTTAEESVNGISTDYEQIGVSAQLTPNFYVSLSDEAGLYLYAGGGFGYVRSTLTNEYYGKPSGAAKLLGTYNLVGGAKIVLSAFLGLDVYYQSVYGDHENLAVGYGAICIAASIMF